MTCENAASGFSAVILRLRSGGRGLAEGVGFEPTVDLHPLQFSRLTP